jgi:hypothetical protein
MVRTKCRIIQSPSKKPRENNNKAIDVPHRHGSSWAAGKLQIIRTAYATSLTEHAKNMQYKYGSKPAVYATTTSKRTYQDAVLNVDVVS